MNNANPRTHDKNLRYRYGVILLGLLLSAALEAPRSIDVPEISLGSLLE